MNYDIIETLLSILKQGINEIAQYQVENRFNVKQQEKQLGANNTGVNNEF